MKKEEVIKRYGEAAWQKQSEQSRVWKRAHREKANAHNKKHREAHPGEDKATKKKYREQHPEKVAECKKKYYEEHPEEVIANHQEEHRKGGKHYEKHLKDNRTGLQGERNAIRKKHAKQYRPYKAIIAPDSQIHHEWVPDTSEYRGLALVEADAHMHGFVDVIEILAGEIALLTEEEVKKEI